MTRMLRESAGIVTCTCLPRLVLCSFQAWYRSKLDMRSINRAAAALQLRSKMMCFLAAPPRCGDAALNVWSRVLNFTTLQVHNKSSPAYLVESCACVTLCYLASMIRCTPQFSGHYRVHVPSGKVICKGLVKPDRSGLCSKP